MARVAAILASAGAGTRFRKALESAPAGAIAPDTPKTFLPLAGKPIWAHGAETLSACGDIDRIVLVVPAALVSDAEAAARALGLVKVAAVVAGGEQRQESVINGLKALADDPPEFVAVCDGARPLGSPELVDRCVRSAFEHGSGVAALPVTDTLKNASADGLVDGTVDRSTLWAMQTPQIFRYDLLLRAHETAISDGCCASSRKNGQ